MRRLRCALILAASLQGCEGGEPNGWSLRQSPLLGPDLVRACLSLYAGAQDCEVVRLSAVPGIYEAQIALAGDGEPVASTVFDIRAGTYTAVVWGMDAEGRAAGFGCGSVVEVGRSDRTDIEVEVLPNATPLRGAPCPPP